MKTKLEIIKEAYGVHFDKLEKYIDLESGFCSAEVPNTMRKKGIIVSVILDKWWPRDLRTRLKNRGWEVVTSETKVDSSKTYEMFAGGRPRVVSGFILKLLIKQKGGVTHFKEITLSEPPIWL